MNRCSRIAERLVEQKFAALLDDYGIADALADEVWNNFGLSRVYDLIKADDLDGLKRLAPKRIIYNIVSFASRDIPDDKLSAYSLIRCDTSFVWKYGLRYFGDPSYEPAGTMIHLTYNLALPSWLRDMGQFEQSKEKLLADAGNRYPVSIRHEVTHALRDAETKHIKRFVERAQKDRKIQEFYTREHDQLEFERDAIINSLDALKRRLGEEKWNEISLNDLGKMIPFMNVLTDLKGHGGREWARRLLREGLVGRGMLEEMRHIVGHP